MRHVRNNIIYIGIIIQEKYSRGWRGAPAKGVGRATGARVQIPLSPLLISIQQEIIFLEKTVDK